MSASLGKRKERDEEGAVKQHGSTLFVSNLPYTATSTDLQTLFSDIAPVRSAFVVTESGTGVSKGVGYVSFSIKEDAEAAFDKISTDGLNLVGRSLRVQWADSKPKEKGEKGEQVKKETKPIPPPRPSYPKATHDPLAIRTIVVSGIPAEIDTKVLWKKFRKCEGAEKVDWPVSHSSEQADTAHVVFATPQNALEAVTKLHAHVFKGNLLSVELKKRLDNLTKSMINPKQAPTTSTAAAPSRAARLIVRNIPFNTSQQDLRALFLPYGPIYSIHIPLETKTDDANVTNDGEEPSRKSNYQPRSQSRTRGFAFVWMNSKKDAERAMEGCNGTVLRAGMAENMISDKQKRKKQRRVEKKMKERMKKGTVEEGKDEDEGEESDHEEDNEHSLDERIVAVDWALSKDKWEEEKAKLVKADDDGEEMEDDAASGSGSSSDSSSGTGSEDEDGIGFHDDGDESGSEYSGDDDNKSDGEDEVPVKPELPAPEAGTTLFVRNVPFTATEDELRTLFRAFGPLRYARITMDPETGRSRGTGFACFWNKDDADKVVAQSDLLRAETGSNETPKQNPFKLPSILTPDPSSSLARSLVLQGRTLDVVRAVTRDQAGKLKEEGERRREKADKRNMYLLREGVILPNSPAATLLSPADLERRSSSFTARKNLLKTNPSLYISKTRLSIRQIPIFVTERMLRRLAAHAVKTFNKEVKGGDRKGLTEDELTVEPEAEAEGDSELQGKNDKEGKKRKPFGRSKPNLTKQAKLVRQQERVDQITGKGRSKGYGFLELNTHADALRVLRWANNNPSVAELWEGWWKEELVALLKAEKNKPENEKEESRIKRVEGEIEKLESAGGGGTALKKSRGTLIVEFSIENVQVVQRRRVMQDERRKTDSTQKTQKRDPKKAAVVPSQTWKEKSEEPAPRKKRKVDEVNKLKDVGDVKDVKDKDLKDEKMLKKPGQSVGFVIGRKRKERRKGK
ncbi:hypothetical protein F5876DRAFT_80216 [Lentinula aff. lateritia]|uniref:Uncharacterized protein n=1 Tax=Lentinula aff. lateritia TaxID=2804960 RepID=A0ACC1TQQ1_9AGAR|nr:hypothetical protein F5876DRAFT_80216 [Lentinula aff. lateritia]